MSTSTKYHIVVSTELEDLKARVNLYLQQGWEIAGGVSCCSVGWEVNALGNHRVTGIQFMQAVQKKGE